MSEPILIPVQHAPLFRIPSPWGEGYVAYWYPEGGLNPATVRAEGVPDDWVHPEVTVRRLSAPPVLDGHLDDPCWTNATRISGFGLLQSGALLPDDEQTWVWLGYDDARFYLALRSRAEAVNPCPARSSENVYINDHLEVFLAPPGVPPPGYFQFVLDPHRIELDGFGYDAAWNAGAEYHSRVRDGVWTAEFAVPFAVLKTAPPADGTRWKANVFRSISWLKYTGWSNAARGYHEPAHFGTLVFDAAAPAVRVDRLGPTREATEARVEWPGAAAELSVRSFGPGTVGYALEERGSARMLWRQTAVFPLHRPLAWTWQSSPDCRRIAYGFTPRPGVNVTARAERTAADRVGCSFEADNRSDTPVPAAELMLCLVLGAMPGFDAEESESYLVIRNGLPVSLGEGLTMRRWGIRDRGGAVASATDPPADLPVVIRRHRTEPRFIAVCWPAGVGGAVNPRHPCMHIHPVLPACPPAETVRIPGEVLFHEGTLAALLERLMRTTRVR
jgi:hypothetical protein